MELINQWRPPRAARHRSVAFQAAMPPFVGAFCLRAAAFSREAGSGVTSNLCHVKVNHSHESPPISSYRGRGPRGRRTGIRRAGRQLETAARRHDRLWMVWEMGPLRSEENTSEIQ